MKGKYVLFRKKDTTGFQIVECLNEKRYDFTINKLKSMHDVEEVIVTSVEKRMAFNTITVSRK